VEGPAAKRRVGLPNHGCAFAFLEECKHRDLIEIMREDIICRYLRLINWLMILGLIAACLWPIYQLHTIKSPAITPSIVEDAKTNPSDIIFDRLQPIQLGFRINFKENELLMRANGICKGEYKFDERDAVTLGLPCAWSADPYHDITWRLRLQCLYPVTILLAAYKVKPLRKYLNAAKILILSWIDSSHFWHEFIWNDHAAAERVFVFARFWHLYRNRNGTCGYAPRFSQKFFDAVAKHAAFLADPKNFTYQTNHGIMQNLSLLYLCAAFPTLPEIKHYKELAICRLREQFGVLVSPNGVMTEHSPGYHAFAMQCLCTANTLLMILGQEAPKEWEMLYEKMENVLIQFLRPDGSLPPIGDTHSSALTATYLQGVSLNRDYADQTQLASKSAKYSSFSIWPWAGYAVLWKEVEVGPYYPDSRQIAFTWANFPEHAHKHADELSVYLYAFGRQWLGGPGYWPYSSPWRTGYATSWRGANAPSYENEPSISRRSANLLGYGHSNIDDFFVDVERIGPKSFRARRQMLVLNDSQLFVFDFIDASLAEHKIISRWHIEEGLSQYLKKSSSNAADEVPFIAQFFDRGKDKSMEVLIKGSENLSVEVVTGQQEPYEGWIYKQGGILPCPTILIKHPGPQAYIVSSFSFVEGSKKSWKVDAFSFHHDDFGSKWVLVLDNENERIQVNKSIDIVHIQRHLNKFTGNLKNSDYKSNESKIDILDTPDLSAQWNTYHKALEKLEAKYPSRKRNLSFALIFKITIGILILWLLQELFIIGLLKRRQKFMLILRAISCLVILTGSSWLIGKFWGYW